MSPSAHEEKPLLKQASTDDNDVNVFNFNGK